MNRCNELSRIVIGCGITVHRNLGPGLLESSYRTCFCYEIGKAGLLVTSEVGLPLVYDDVRMETGYRMDILVENQLVVEIKCVECLNPVHTAQILTYMKLSGAPLGLLFNFNVLRLKDGIKRFINRDNVGFQEDQKVTV